jgi:aspartyl/asparaginyl-tRNA synthetase
MAEPDQSGQPPSKNALKKAAKDAEKAKKKAEQAKIREEELAIRQRQEAASDFATANYGEKTTSDVPGSEWVLFTKLHEYQDKICVFRCAIENSRGQSAKLGFLAAGQGIETVQLVLAEDGTNVSKQMIKFAIDIPSESLCLIHGLVKSAPEKIKSATIQDYEVHVQKIFIVSKAFSPLPLQPVDSERALPSETEVEESSGPLVSLNTRLNNRVLDLRAKINHCVFVLKDGVDALFQEFLRARGFIRIHTPKIIGAASEGGSNVFRLDYFQKSCYLAQSPQLYKQMAIQGRFPRVMEIGPVFRAENSNTARHLTEFTGLDLEMEIENNYHEVIDLLENLMLFIFKGLNDRYSKETKLIGEVYPVHPFKLPTKAPRLSFIEGIKMLRDAGETLGDHDDLTTPQEKKLGQLVLEKVSRIFHQTILYWLTASVRV